MGTQRTEFQQYIENEVARVKGIYYPVKAGFFQQAFVKKAAPSKLHPNPGDEFCDPRIGPNYEIISGYEKQYRRVVNNPNDLLYMDGPVKEPIIVEKTRPDGYMILNGHHRWAAATRAGMRRLGIRIVNLTSETDLKKMLEAGGSDRRVSLDLDEVVLRGADDPDTEPPLRFPMNRVYRERLRRGIPALFTLLDRKGYDIWVYTVRYYSYEYLKYFFKRHHLHVTGIVTRPPKETSEYEENRKQQKKKLAEKYRAAVMIDNRMVTCTRRGEKDVKVYDLTGDPAGWSREVTEIIEGLQL